MRRCFWFVFLVVVSVPGLAGDKSLSDAVTAPHSGLDLSALDTTADPCVDFYQYSCGGWRQSHPIPSDRPLWNRYSEMADRNLLILREILEKATDKSAKRSAIAAKAGDLYGACMDEKLVESKGASPLQPWLKRIDALTSKQQMMELVADLHKNAISALFNFASQPDLRDATKVVADVDQGGLGLPDRDYYTRTTPKAIEQRAKYVEFVGEMFRLLGDSPEAAAANAKTVMSIETELAKPSLDNVARRDPKVLANWTNFSELKAKAPGFEFGSYFAASGAPAFAGLNVSSPKFFSEVSKQIEAVPLNDWKTYLRWRVVRFAASSLSPDFVNADFRFNSQYLRGTKTMPDRWKRCVQAVDQGLGDALGQLYVEQNFSAEGKKRFATLLNNVADALADDIKQVDWMTDATRKLALEKLAAIRRNKIGYPDKWLDYSNVTIVRDDLLGDRMRAAAFNRKRRIDRIGKGVDAGDWEMSPPTVNAYYDPQKAEIVFPAGMLQPPMFSQDFDDALNYGAVGRVVGHELTHGFDDEGRKFDKVGNLKDWWTEADSKAFEERASCIADQYSEYVAVEDKQSNDVVKLNGRLTLGENTADNGGVRVAYMAYRKASADKPRDEKLDGYTRDQLFFLGYAATRCENLTDAIARLLAQTDPHSPGKYRLLGPVTNMSEFARAFGCKKGQPMVREKTCRVW